jgi:hypothetical protein
MSCESTVNPAACPMGTIGPRFHTRHRASHAFSTGFHAVRSLDEAEACNFGCAKTDGYIYPSYYEKNADNITFSVADWVRRVLPAERLPPADRQPMFTVHDIPDWDGWLNPAPTLRPC